MTFTEGADPTLLSSGHPATLTFAPRDSAIIFHANAHNEIMRLDAAGMTYKGQRIEDGGEAHRAFLEVMEAMKNQFPE